MASKKFNWARCDVPRLISTGRQIDWSHSEEALYRVVIMCSELLSKILHAIHQSSQFPHKILQKKEYQYAKFRSKVRNSVVHERKRTMRGIFQHFSVTRQSHFCPSEAEEKYELVERKLKEDNEKKTCQKCETKSEIYTAYPNGLTCGK